MSAESEHQTGKADGEIERKKEREEVPLHVARFVHYSAEVTHTPIPTPNYPKLNLAN